MHWFWKAKNDVEGTDDCIDTWFLNDILNAYIWIYILCLNMLIYAYINLGKMGVVILKKAKTSIVEGDDDGILT